ncbi:hypothetical protein ABKN59_005445 [Abortiporus biennis]
MFYRLIFSHCKNFYSVAHPKFQPQLKWFLRLAPHPSSLELSKLLIHISSCSRPNSRCNPIMKYHFFLFIVCLYDDRDDSKQRTNTVAYQRGCKWF